MSASTDQNVKKTFPGHSLFAFLLKCLLFAPDINREDLASLTFGQCRQEAPRLGPCPADCNTPRPGHRHWAEVNDLGPIQNSKGWDVKAPSSIVMDIGNGLLSTISRDVLWKFSKSVTCKKSAPHLARRHQLLKVVSVNLPVHLPAVELGRSI